MKQYKQYRQSHIVNLISERSITEQKLVLQGILEYFNERKIWKNFVTFASCLPRDSKMGRLWGGYGEKSFNHRNKLVKRFFNESVKRANPRLRSKHMPYLFVHEFRPADKDSTMYSGHCHAVFGCNDLVNINFDPPDNRDSKDIPPNNGRPQLNDDHRNILYMSTLDSRMHEVAQEYRKEYGIEVDVRSLWSCKGVIPYISKFVDYSKDLNMNYGLHRLICTNEKEVDRKIKDMFIAHKEMINELRKKAFAELNERYPCYKKESFIN